ncbi:hypothetical protein CV014_09415 [Nostoc sp. CMAA1605]|nr:hypothetical protein [Nostoc sp. CMAA1605]
MISSIAVIAYLECGKFNPDFSRDLENPSPNLRGFNFPPSLVGKGVRGLGFTLTFPHNVKSQV